MAISLEVKKFVNTEYVGKFAEIELPIAQPEDEEPPRKARKKPDKKDKKEKKASFIRKRADYDGDDLIVKVFAGRDGEYSLYEDDGLTYAYENGGYSWVPMRWHDADCVLEICAVEGGFDGMAKEKDIIVELHDVDGSIILKSVEYKGDDMMVTF